MKKIIKYLIITLLPLGIIKFCHWLMFSPFAHLQEPMTFTSPIYPLQLFLYFTFALFIFFLYRCGLEKKEWPVFIIPLVYLLFLSMPYGVFLTNDFLANLMYAFSTKLALPPILFFTYVIRIVLLFLRPNQALNKNQE